MFNDTGRYIIRSDTLANWNNFNPILRYGELVAIYSANEIPKLKIGNGTDNFTDLPILNYDIQISDTEYLSNVVLSCQGFRDEAVESKQFCEAANTSVTNMKTEITNMYNEVKTLSCFKVQNGLLCVAVEV